jgi:hypothetical protein
MSPIFNSLVQGAIAGGTTVYLQDRVNREASEKKTGTWLSVALQVNHLFLLMVETLQAVGIPFGLFGTFVRAIFILTPLVLLNDLREEKISEQEAQVAQQVNKIYYVGVIAVSVATLVLGNPLFAITSLSMLAIDALVAGKAKEIFAQIKKTAGVLAIVGYGAEVFAGQNMIAALAMVSTITIVFKLFVWDLLVAPNLPSRNRPSTYVPPVVVQNPPPPRNPRVIIVDDRPPPPVFIPSIPRSNPPVVIVNNPPPVYVPPRPKSKPSVVIVNNPPPPVYKPAKSQPKTSAPPVYIPKTPSAPPPEKPVESPAPSKPKESLWGGTPTSTTQLEPLVRKTGLWS